MRTASKELNLLLFPPGGGPGADQTEGVKDNMSFEERLDRVINILQKVRFLRELKRIGYS